MCMVAAICNVKDNSIENKDRLESVIKLMLKGMSESNKDGTGIVLSTQENQVLMTKTAKVGSEVAETFVLDIALDYRHFVFHTRLATMGPRSDLNAHPHETKFGHLVHNGWCPSLYNAHKEQMKTGCDSEALAYVFNPNLDLFSAALNGYEHFAVIHLDNEGKKVLAINKNKCLYQAYSKVLSAELVLTSQSVLSDIGKLLNESLDIKPIHDNHIMSFDGKNTNRSEFKFVDKGYEHMLYEWESGQSTWKEDWKRSQSWAGRNLEPVQRRLHNNQPDMPRHIKKMTRRERKQWIRENKARREEYVQFWHQQREIFEEQSAENAQERDWDKEGFQIVDYMGNIVNED